MEKMLLDLLKNSDKIDNWKLEVVEENRDEMYLIFDQVEQKRIVEELLYKIEILVNVEENGKKYTGKGSFQVLPGEDLEIIEARLNDAIVAAKLTLNPFYEYDDFVESDIVVDNCDKDILNSKSAVMDDLKNRIYNVVDRSEVKLASSELFLKIFDIVEYNSKGLENHSKKSEVVFEAVLMAGEGENEVESHLIRQERFVENLDIDKTLKKYIEFAKDNIEAGLPKSGKFDVVFTEEALDTFFSYYAAQVEAGMKYNKMSTFELGDKIVDNFKGDKLNLSFNPHVKGGLNSMKYDSYGTLVKKIDLICDGKIERFSANKKYATYLDMECNGDRSNIEVKPGSTEFKEMKKDGTFVLSKFSTFTPNVMTGAFSGEIRNGYFIDNGKRIPVKGGSVTGIMKKAMENVRFSKEVVIRRGYKGPEYIKVCDVDVSGI